MDNMYPVILDLGVLQLHTYGLMIAIGFLTAVYFMSRDAERVGVNGAEFSEMAFWGLLVGIIGTRLAHIFMFPQFYSWSDPVGWIALWRGGLVFQGAIPVVFIYAYLVLRWRKIPFWKVPDFVFPYIPVAQAFGRMGCLFYGCCYGMRADNLPWAIRFPAGSPAYHAHAALAPDVLGPDWSLPIHPTQLYSVLLLSIIAGLLLMARRYINIQGITLPLYLILYGTKRVIVEFFRGDGNPTELAGGVLSDQQVFSIWMIVAGVIILFFVVKRKQPSESPPWLRAKEVKADSGK